MPSVATKIKPFESLAWDGNLQQVINRDASSPYPTLTNTPQLRIQNTNRKQFRIAHGPYCFLIILYQKHFYYLQHLRIPPTYLRGCDYGLCRLSF